MSRSECPYEPFTCDCSLFLEGPDKLTGEIKRWVECREYFINEEWLEDIRETGEICVKNPSDWWNEYIKYK